MSLFSAQLTSKTDYLTKQLLLCSIFTDSVKFSDRTTKFNTKKNLICLTDPYFSFYLLHCSISVVELRSLAREKEAVLDGVKRSSANTLTANGKKVNYHLLSLSCCLKEVEMTSGCVLVHALTCVTCLLVLLPSCLPLCRCFAGFMSL